MRPGRASLISLVVLAVLQAVFSGMVVMPRYNKDFVQHTQTGKGQPSLAPEMMFLQMFGFREFLAGMLWVRADTYFESGDYDSILPIIRMTTWLDPHYIDVYATGMWHLGYNFTDEEGRSDRRYVPYALALGMEGAQNNDQTYEMFFETGWMWFHKIEDDQENSVEWFKEANKRDDMLAARRNLLGVALQRAGQLDEALKWYGELLQRAEKKLKTDNEHADRTNRDTIENNLDNLIVRMVTRGVMAQERNDGTYLTMPYDTQPPFDVGFSCSVTVEEPLVLRVQGTWGVKPVGCRLRFILRDANYPRSKPAGMDWGYTTEVSLEPPQGITWMQDGLFVKNQKFNRKVDMSRDPTMYPCKEPEYVMEVFYDPRNAPAHIQDKFGWNGEGMTDQRYLRKDVREGRNVLYCALKLTRDQLWRRGEWVDKTPVISTPNYKALPTSGSFTGDVIVVPGLRATPKPGPKPGLPQLGNMGGQ